MSKCLGRNRPHYSQEERVHDRWGGVKKHWNVEKSLKMVPAPLIPHAHEQDSRFKVPGNLNPADVLAPERERAQSEVYFFAAFLVAFFAAFFFGSRGGNSPPKHATFAVGFSVAGESSGKGASLF